MGKLSASFVFFLIIGCVSACNKKRQIKVPTPLLQSAFKMFTCNNDQIFLHFFSSQTQNGLSIGPDNLDKLQFFETAEYKPKTELKVIIHGWRSSGNETWVKNIKNAYLSRGDCNVIVVDWGTIASCYTYLQSMKKTKYISQTVANLLQTLISNGKVAADRVHIIGHSLGAHIAGIVGFTINPLIGRITGLDVARPGYQLVLSNTEYLDASDAEFVDVIHTTAGITGWVAPIGHADFYPNRGVAPQPGCSREDLIVPNNPVSYGEATIETVKCSHSRAHDLFLESIFNHSLFKAVKCPWDLTLRFNKCDSNVDFEIMGDYCSSRAKGTFYLETNSRPPFAKG